MALRSENAEGTMRMLAMGVAIVLCLAVSACAGTGGSNGAGITKSDSEIDVGKVIAVNEWALRRHATVMWVNYPKKARESKDTSG
jgi:hypothetical protein